MFTIRDTFVGYTARDTVGSLLISSGISRSRCSSSSDKDIAVIQSSLMHTATFQGIARSLLSTSRNGDYQASTREICEEYLSDKRHINLYNFIKAMTDCKAVVTTYSKYFILDISNKQMFPYHMDDIQIAKLSLFTSERDMVDYIQQFYSINNNDKSMMIIQCDIVDDKKNLLLLKFEIDRAFTSYRDMVEQQQKRFVLLLTVGTELYEEDRSIFYDCYFSPGWDHFHIDNIEENEALYLRTVNIVLDNKANSFESFLMYDNMCMVRSIFTEDIMSYLGLIKYTTTDEGSLKMLADKLVHNLALVDLICNRTIIEIVKDDNLNHGWVYTCACYREGLEFSSSSLVSAMRIFVKQRMRNPATACIYLLEKYNALDTYTTFQLIPPAHTAVFMNTKLPLDEQEFRVNCSSYGKFRFPLCMLLIEKIRKIKNLFITGGPIMMNNEGNRLYFTNRIKHDIDEFYTENCILDNNYRDALSIELKDDFIRHFLLSSFGSVKIEAAIVALKSYFPNFDSIELSAAQIQVMLWENKKYFRYAVALMIYDKEKIILFADLHRQNEIATVIELIQIDRKRYDEQNLRIQTFLLIIDFCKVSLAKMMKSNLSVNALITWSREMVTYITLVDDLVKITNMNYFTFSLDNDEYKPDVRLYYELMRY